MSKKTEYFWNNHQVTDLDGEEWIDCIGYDGIYQVSNLGRVKSVERFMETRPNVGYVKPERIRKQSYSKEFSGVRVFLCSNGKTKAFMTSRLVFFSFNYNVKNLPEYYVMHKNNDWADNRLENLKIGTQQEIASLTFENGKMEHIKKGNPIPSKHSLETSVFKDGLIISKLCKDCNENKDIKEFRYGNNACKVCVWNKRRVKIGTKNRRCNGLKATCQLTGNITIYKNYNDKDLLKLISVVTAMNHVKNKTICNPYLKKHNFNPFKLEEINEVGGKSE